MRVIKFRAWGNEKRYWVKDFYINSTKTGEDVTEKYLPDEEVKDE